MSVLSSSPRRDRVWPLWLFCLLALVVTAAGSLIAFVVTPPGASAGPLDPAAFPGLIIATEISLGSFAVLAATLSNDRIVDRLRIRRPRLDAWRAALLVLTAAALGKLLLVAHVVSGTPVRGVWGEIGKTVLAANHSQRVAIAIAITMFPAVAEELFFRGFLQTRLTRRFGRGASVILSSAAFGLFHMDAEQGAFAFVLGLWVGALAELSGSIVIPILAHAANNGMAMILPVPTGTYGRVGYTGIAAALVIAGLVVLVQTWRRAPPEREPVRDASWPVIARAGVLVAYLGVVFGGAVLGAVRAMPMWRAMSDAMNGATSAERTGVEPPLAGVEARRAVDADAGR